MSRIRPLDIGVYQLTTGKFRYMICIWLNSSVHGGPPSQDSSLVNWFDSTYFGNLFDSTHDPIRFFKNESIHLVIQAVTKNNVVWFNWWFNKNHLILIQFTIQIRIIYKSMDGDVPGAENDSKSWWPIYSHFEIYVLFVQFALFLLNQLFLF